MEKKMQVQDWQDVVDLNPSGYAEFNNGKVAMHGPIESVHVDDADWVHIKMKWAATRRLNGVGLPAPDSEWEAVPEWQPAPFPNVIVPFVIEATPAKGKRVRFGLNLLYLQAESSLDPKDVRGLNID
jgi:hypothetical protein